MEEIQTDKYSIISETPLHFLGLTEDLRKKTSPTAEQWD